MSTLGHLEREWQPFTPCPCGCGVVGSKLSIKSGHVMGCACRPCIGLRNRRKGQRNQSKALKAAARAEGRSMEIAPTHEEQARLLIHYEVKSGEQVDKAGPAVRAEWEKQAEYAAHRQVPCKKWAVVTLSPSGKQRITLDYHEWLQLVAEIMEAS